MNIKTLVFATCAGLAMTTTGYAQNAPASLEQLQQAATGAQFDVGSSQFTLAPAASVVQVNEGTGMLPAAVANYAITLPMQGAALSRSASASRPANAKLAAAISANGTPAVVTSTVRVYFDSASSVASAARATGGTVLFTSDAAGMAHIEFNTVNDALAAAQRITGMAGIRGTEMEVIEAEITKL